MNLAQQLRALQINIARLFIVFIQKLNELIHDRISGNIVMNIFISKCYLDNFRMK